MKKVLLCILLTLSIILGAFGVAYSVSSNNALDIKEVNKARTALSMVEILYPVESLDVNVVTMAQQIVDSAANGVMVSIDTTSNSQVSQNGAVIYGDLKVINTVVFKLVKNTSKNTQGMIVEVPVKYEEVPVIEPPIIVEGTTCSSLGMIPDNESSGASNYIKLLAEVKKGTKINVDGIYYLRSSTSSNLVSNLYLTGKTKDISKLILQGGTFFTLNGKAVVENISIECPTNNVTIFIRMNAPFINDITIRNNYITGNIMLLYSATGSNNFNTTPCYISSLEIDNNEFYDVYTSSNSKIIIYLCDTAVKSCNIINNKITNFSYIFYHNGITNGHAYKDYLYKNSNVVIKNNVVKCTDDYNAKVRNGGVTWSYYTFTLMEGNKGVISNNTFEGIHIFDAPNTVVYDNYISTISLLYENNTWKNIINFTANIADVDIMKSKTAYECGIKRERIYRTNTYIVEPGYADRFNKDRFLLRKEINSLTSEVDEIIIEDNYIDVYILSFRYWGLKFYEDLYKFTGNTILMDTVEHSKINQAMVYVGDNKDSSGASIPRNAIFTNNKIICDTKPFGAGVGTVKFSLISNVTTSTDKTVVEFSNNEIKYPDYIFNASNITGQAKNGTIINYKNNIINGIVTTK